MTAKASHRLGSGAVSGGVSVRALVLSVIGISLLRVSCLRALSVSGRGRSGVSTVRALPNHRAGQSVRFFGGRRAAERNGWSTGRQGRRAGRSTKQRKHHVVDQMGTERVVEGLPADE